MKKLYYSDKMNSLNDLPDGSSAIQTQKIEKLRATAFFKAENSLLSVAQAFGYRQRIAEELLGAKAESETAEMLEEILDHVNDQIREVLAL